MLDCIGVVSLSGVHTVEPGKPKFTFSPGDGLRSVTHPVGKKCSRQSKGFLEDFSLYGQGVVEGLILFFKETRCQSAAVIVWAHTSPAYVGARCPQLRNATNRDFIEIKCD
jgi:hypothetical protein